MAEISRPWNGITTGDSGPYSDDQWSDVWLTLLGPLIASEGVFVDQLNELDLSNAVSPVSINTGRALVDGVWYENNAAVSVAVPTPGANPRIDRIVLRKDWTVQTVRITRIAGTEAASPVPPAITQVDGTTWDLPLWQVHITTGGVITHFRDERQFIGSYNPVGTPNENNWYVEDDFHWPILVFAAANDQESVKIWTLSISAGAGNTIEAVSASGRGSGIVRLSHGGGTTDAIQITSNAFRPDQDNARVVFIAKEPNTHANLDRIIGLVSGGGSLTPSDGVYFRNDAGAGSNWIAVTRAGAVETITDTGIALADTFKKMEIEWREAQSVTFLIDDMVVATHLTDIPSNTALSANVSIFDDGSAPTAQEYQDVDLFNARGNR